MQNIKVHISVPKAICASQTLSLKPGTLLLEALCKVDPDNLIKRIAKNESEFNQFVLIYHDDVRIKDPSFPLMDDCSIDVIIPMAGG